MHSFTICDKPSGTSTDSGSEMMVGSWLMILSWIWVYWARQLLKYRWHISRNFYRRCQDSNTAQQPHSHWLASSFVQFSPYRNGIQNFLGDTFGGTVYPEDISCGGTQYPRILCTGIQKTRDAKYPMTPETKLRFSQFRSRISNTTLALDKRTYLSTGTAIMGRNSVAMSCRIS